MPAFIYGTSRSGLIPVGHRYNRSNAIECPTTHARPQLVYAKELSNTPVIYITKLSILLQFERIFAPIHSGVAYWSIQAVIWLNALYYLACVLATVFLCNPMRKVWQPWIAGHCSNTNALIISSSLINLVSDLIIFVIPLFCVMKLQMPTSRKFGVAAVFAVGLL